jgi:hypothetical protein
VDDAQQREPVAKPDALLALHDVTSELFLTLRRWFGVPVAVSLDLAEIDSAVEELGDPVMIAAMAMRKLQALHLLATPGVMTTTDVVITIVQDLDRALVQAPSMRLKLQAASTDWDAAFAELGRHASATPPEGSANHPSRVDDPDGVPLDPAQSDPATERFRELHARLHEAVFAVLEVSAGEIRYLL